jgi:hypothetical protein
MRFLKSPVWLCFAALTFLSSSITAAPVSSCAADFSSCNVYEGQTLTYPDGGFGYSGDVIVNDPSGITVDVFRIFNDLVDTGGGTGLGSYAFLYGADLGNLPSPSTYSINAVSINRGGAGPAGYYETDYLGNGTLYRLFTPSPEPSAFVLFGLGALALGGFLSKRSHQ